MLIAHYYSPESRNVEGRHDAGLSLDAGRTLDSGLAGAASQSGQAAGSLLSGLHDHLDGGNVFISLYLDGGLAYGWTNPFLSLSAHNQCIGIISCNNR